VERGPLARMRADAQCHLLFTMISTAKRLHYRAQGWLRFLQPTLGKEQVQSTLKGLYVYMSNEYNPFGVDANRTTALGSVMQPLRGRNSNSRILQ
jgi:hypothetical protein